MDSSIRTLPIVACIVVIISGYHDGLGKTKHRLCYETRLINFCTDLRPYENMTSPLDGAFRPNLIINVPNITRLNLSMNEITTLRFQASGDIELMVNLECPFSKSCSSKREKECLKVQCIYFQVEHHEQLRSSKDNVGHNATSWVQTLILASNSIRSLDSIFTPLENLQYLDLSHNLIENLQEGFSKNSKLVTLKLNNNLIESLQKETFKHLKNLQSLDLSGNRFTRLNLDVFEYLNDLLVLRLNDNFHFANYSDEISFILSAGQKFERLEMTGTSLSRVPIALTRSIRELDLTSNRLRLIQCGEMDSYPLLHTLSLKNNKLETVEDDSLGRLEYLVELNLYGNSLTRIPLSLPLTLQRLNLGTNTIEGIAKTDLEGLGRLQVLIVSGNKIDYIEASAFSPLTSLEYLDLSNNPIKRLSSNQFAGTKRIVNLQMSQLRELNCEGIANCLGTFPFTELDHLEILNLNGSPVLSQQLLLDQSAVQALSHLKELNLVSTNVTKLSSELTKHLTRLQKLEIHENHLDCSNVGWLKEWLASMRMNYLKESHPNNVTDTDDFANIRIIWSQSQDHFTKQLDNGSNNLNATPICFLPVEMRGISLLDFPVETRGGVLSASAETNDSSKQSGRKLTKELGMGAVISLNNNFTLTAGKKRESQLPSAMVQLKPAIEESICDKIDKGTPISNSILTIEKSNEEVFYQNDEPEASAVAVRSKDETNITAVKNFDIINRQEVQYVIDESKQAKKTDEIVIENNSDKNQTSGERDKTKTGKQEVKSINKTHIELSRSGSRNKNLEVTYIRPDTGIPETNVGITEKTVIKSSAKKTTSITNNGGKNSVKPNLTRKESESLHTTISTFTMKIQSTTKKLTEEDTEMKEPSTKSAISLAPTHSSEMKRQRVERQGVTQLVVTTLALPVYPSESTITDATPQTSTQKPRKNKTLDEKSGSRPTRKKLLKKLKDITTIQPEITLLLTHPDETTTSSSQGRTHSAFEQSTAQPKNKQIDETVEKPQIPITKKISNKKIIATSKIDTQNNSSSTMTPDALKNETYRGKIEQNIDQIMSENNQSILLKNSDLQPNAKIEDHGKKQLSNTPRRLVTDAGDNRHDTIEKDKDSRSHKNSNNIAETIKNITIGVKEENRLTNKIKENDHLRTDIDRNKVNKEAIQTSSKTSKPETEELKFKHGSLDKSRTLSGEKSVSDVYFARAKYDSNVENKDDLEKGGSHPGMLIFLLIVSVLLFSLSLMLISHWTWCRRLNMYDVSDQQILEESDYEINSLTNFKEPERW